MKPNDENGKLPLEKRPYRVLLISGSDRRQYNCPGVDSKSRALMLRMAGQLPEDWEIDMEDLGNVYARARIQSCNACVSTSMALCVWPCNCYEKNSKTEPDLMWDLDLYSRLDLADAWAIIGPVNWYAPSSNLKLMFDRLVCMNGGNPREDLIQHKDPEMAMRLEHAPEWEELSVKSSGGQDCGVFLLRRRWRRRTRCAGTAKDSPPQTILRSRAGALQQHARCLCASRVAMPVRRNRGS